MGRSGTNWNHIVYMDVFGSIRKVEKQVFRENSCYNLLFVLCIFMYFAIYECIF